MKIKAWFNKHILRRNKYEITARVSKYHGHGAAVVSILGFEVKKYGVLLETDGKLFNSRPGQVFDINTDEKLMMALAQENYIHEPCYWIQGRKKTKVEVSTTLWVTTSRRKL